MAQRHFVLRSGRFVKQACRYFAYNVISSKLAVRNNEISEIMKPDENKKLMLKGAVIVLTALFMMIPVLMVRNVVDEREELSEQVAREITRSWGGEQTVSPPSLRVMYDENCSEGYVDYRVFSSASDEADISGEVAVDILHRSIYDVPVYRAELDFKGTIKPSDELVRVAMEKGRCCFCLDLGHLLGVEGEVEVNLNGQKLALSPSEDGSLTADIPDSLVGKPLDYSFRLLTRGSERLGFKPEAARFSMTLKSGFRSPGFSGAFLPVRREISEEGFEAEWDITSTNTYGMGSSSLLSGVDFVVPVSQYQRTVRAMKYSFMVILLVYMAVFIGEYLTRRKVNIVQYIVTGLSLCLFYLLLLAFTEYMPFWLSYTLSSILTVASLCMYFRAILRLKAAYAFAGIVAFVYIFIYLLLQMENGSLLIGASALFVILCVIMYFTGNVRRPCRQLLQQEEHREE